MYLSKRNFIFFKIVSTAFALFLFPLVLFASQSDFRMPKKDIEIRMNAKSIIDADQVTLASVASIFAKNIHEYEALANLELMKFPSDKKKIEIPREYLQRRIAEVVDPEASIDIIIPEKISIERSAPLMSVVSLEAKINDWIHLNARVPMGVEISIKNIELPIDEIAQDAEISIQPAREKIIYRGFVDLFIKVKNQNFAAKADVRWSVDVWKFKHDVKFQQSLSLADFVRTRTDITDLFEPLVLAKDEAELGILINGAHAKRSISANAVLAHGLLDKKADLKSGQNLKVMFVAESGLKVMAEAQLISDAILGDTVKAKLKKSRKIVSGKLINNDLVEVKL